ncbi:MAG: hypothetical protein HC898_09045 [Phycisphaerales bacterium]|nr:hypothetical protein [Phycisphaerales bacterium]
MGSKAIYNLISIFFLLMSVILCGVTLGWMTESVAVPEFIAPSTDVLPLKIGVCNFYALHDSDSHFNAHHHLHFYSDQYQYRNGDSNANRYDNPDQYQYGDHYLNVNAFVYHDIIGNFYADVHACTAHLYVYTIVLRHHPPGPNGDVDLHPLHHFLLLSLPERCACVLI